MPDNTPLLGSSIQPSHFKLMGGKLMQLGDVVRSAFSLSGFKTVEQWNNQPELTREGFIQTVVDGLPIDTSTTLQRIEQAHPDVERAAKAVALAEQQTKNVIHEVLHKGLNEMDKLQHFTVAEVKFLSQYLGTEFNKLL